MAKKSAQIGHQYYAVEICTNFHLLPEIFENKNNFGILDLFFAEVI